MPEGSAQPGAAVAGQSRPAPGPVRSRDRWVSPLMRRILVVNAMPLALLLATLLYLDQYQNGLLEAEVGALRQQAKIHAGALSEAAVREEGNEAPRMLPDAARGLLRRLTEPTPNAQAKLYAPDGQVIVDTRIRQGAGGTVFTEPLPPAIDRGALVGTIEAIYDRVLDWLPGSTRRTRLDISPTAVGPDWQPDVKEEIRLSGTANSRETPPYIRRTSDNRLLVSVAEPVVRNRTTVGIVLLTREAREVDDSLLAVRLSILSLFALALALTVALSWYLSLTIARPILRLAGAAEQMQEGRGRAGAVPATLLARRDEIGELAQALGDSAQALWNRMDAIERFAADVAHEIKNPLTSIRSAIETLRRIEEPEKQRRLLAIIAEDVARLDRLISDISDASRIDAELSRAATEAVDVTPILEALAEIDEATRREDHPQLVLAEPRAPAVVQAVEDRLVQVLRNLIGNAQSFSPARGRILISATPVGSEIEIIVEDDGPGIPDAKLESIFDRFYSERPQGERFGQHSGLGLSISRQIVEALRGTIAAENRRDEAGRVTGARFTVRLPKA